jgi:hypothetical protein
MNVCVKGGFMIVQLKRALVIATGTTFALFEFACVPQDSAQVCTAETTELSLTADTHGVTIDDARIDWTKEFSASNPRTKMVRDETVGVSLHHPDVWTVVHDEVRFHTYGFILRGVDEDPMDAHGALPVARIARDDSPEHQLEEIVRAKMAEYPGVRMTRTPIVVDGRPAIALGPVPGGQVSTNVYVAANGYVYRINYYGETLDARGRALIGALKLESPKRAIATLDLPRIDERPQISFTRHALKENAPRETQTMPPDFEPDPCDESISAATAEYQLSNGCWAQPTSFFIQTTHSRDANGSGWSQMGTPNFWGDNTHGNWGLGRCVSDYYTNDLYAIDYYLNTGDRLFSPFKEGYVQYAGWDPENWWNYGRMVVIASPSGKFWSLSAHLSSINVSAGDYVTDDTLIGWAGSTGYADPYPHVHQVFYRWPSSSWGRPYGGAGLRQTALHYIGNGGGTYTNFFKGKWASW